jgi:Uma2 family endonuclease
MATAGRRAGVRGRRWSKAEYHRLGELGFFAGQRTELLEGQVVVQSPQNPEHAFHVDRFAQVLRMHFGQGFWVRMQLPLDLGQATEPEPDVSVVAGDPTSFRSAHPTAALLIVEVSDTTVSHDRRRKGSLYARAGVADYWLVNLVRRRVEVYRDPVPDPRRPYGHRYAARADRTPPAIINPLALPQAAAAVADLLP